MDPWNVIKMYVCMYEEILIIINVPINRFYKTVEVIGKFAMPSQIKT
jgi:hypothetical protein